MEAPQLEQKKLTDWANEPTLADLKSDHEAAQPNHDAIVARIDHWENLRKVEGSAKPKKVKGRSTIQPKLIRRQAEWRYSALSEPFLGSNKLFNVSPITFEDEAGAKQNELVLNHQFRNKLDRVSLIDNFVRATVDEGTSIIRLGWSRITKPVIEEVPVYTYYPIQDEESMAQLEEAIQLKEADPRGFDENVPEELKAAVEFFEETGQPAIAQISGYEQIETEEIIENQPTVEVMNPNNVIIDPSCNGNLDRAMFAIVSFETNKAELLKYGDRYKNLDEVDWESANPSTEPNHATSTPSDYRTKDSKRSPAVAYEYWGYHDINDNDELVPIVATWIGNTLIRMEENPFPDGKLPFVVVPYSPVKRELYGESDAEILEDNQKVLGAVMRGMIDLMGRSANAQQGFAKGMLDPVNRRRYENGLDYEYNPNSNPNMSLIEHKYPEIPNSAMLMLNLQNQEAEAISGTKSFSGGLSGEAYGDVAAGIRGMLDAASKREMAILRRLAKGITEVGKKIIAMNQVFLSEEEVVRISNRQFVSIKREDLAGNYDLEVDISTAEVDDAKSQDLGFMLQTVGPNADPQVMMRILAEIADLKRMPALAEELRTWSPQPSPQEEAMMELELEIKRAELAKIQSEVELNQARARREMADAGQQEVDTEEQITGEKHAKDMEKHKAQSEGNQNLELLKALTKPQKPEESPPNIDAALGFRAISGMIGNTGNVSNSMQRDQAAIDDPRYNLNSPQFDPSLDPALNPNFNV